MCGRFTLTAALKTIQGRFELDDEEIGAIEPDYHPNDNVSPTQKVLTLYSAGEKPVPSLMRWGLVPSWSKQKKTDYSLINARAETIDTKPMFRSLIARNRCLIVADGFYEFRAEGKRKIPVRFSMKDDSLFSMAGIYDRWKDPGSDSVLISCAIITTEPNDLVREVHSRMPVILARPDEPRWLDVSLNPVDLKMLLTPYDPKLMRTFDVDPVDPAIRNGKTDDLFG